VSKIAGHVFLPNHFSASADKEYSQNKNKRR
jgi:hypothetical protein